MNHSLYSIAATSTALFGNPWLALLLIIAGIAVLLALVAGVGRWLAATHPANPAAIPDASSAATPHLAPVPAVIPPAHVLAIIAAAVRVTFGASARIAQVVPVKPVAPSVETLMQQWSMEGRRQIYSSHQIR